MNTVQRFISGLMLGGMTLAMVPLVSAEEVSTTAHASVQAEIRLALKACNEKETADEKRACAKVVYEKYKDSLPNLGQHMKHGIGRILPPVLKADMKECKEMKEKDDRKECNKTAREDFKNARTELRDGLKTACSALTDPTEKKACAKKYAEDNNLKEYRIQKPMRKLMHAVRRSPEEIRDQLKSCRDAHDNDFAAFKTCIEEVRASIKANVDSETEVNQ